MDSEFQELQNSFAAERCNFFVVEKIEFQELQNNFAAEHCSHFEATDEVQCACMCECDCEC